MKLFQRLGFEIFSHKQNIGQQAFTKNVAISEGMSIFIAEHHAVTVFGMPNKVLVKTVYFAKDVKLFFTSHFDNKYTIHEWRSYDKGTRYTVVKQLFRHITGDDYDSFGEFVIVWSRLSTDDLHEYVDGLFYDNCGHDFDCCGCWFTDLWTHRTKRVGPLCILFLSHARNV